MCLAHGKFGVLTLRLHIHLQYRLDGVDPVWLNADAPRTAIYTTISLQQGPILGEFFRRDFSLFL